MAKQKCISLFDDQLEVVSFLNDEQLGRVVRAAMQFMRDGTDACFDGCEGMFYRVLLAQFVRQQIDQKNGLAGANARIEKIEEASQETHREESRKNRGEIRGVQEGLNQIQPSLEIKETNVHPYCSSNSALSSGVSSDIAVSNSSRSGSVLFCCSFIKILLITSFIKAQHADATAEKVVDVIIAVPVLCPEVLVDHVFVTVRVYVHRGIGFVRLIDVRHFADDAFDLYSAYRRVRSARVRFVLLEVVSEHLQHLRKAVRAVCVHRRGDLREPVNIKKQPITSNRWGKPHRGFAPLYPYTFRVYSLGFIVWFPMGFHWEPIGF